MSILREYRDTEAAINELQSYMEELGRSEELKVELAFEKALRELMAVYGKSLKDVIRILDPKARESGMKSKAPVSRRARQVKRYTNPHDGTVVDSKGGNNRVLQEWKSVYGKDTVEGWATILD